MGYGIRTLLLGLLSVGAAAAQQQTPPPPPPPPETMPPQVTTTQTAAPTPPANPNAPETVTRDEPATFKARVNLVMVPVVVRDKQGKAVGGLHQEDFQLFDKSKPQTITRFSSEKSSGRVKPADSSDAVNKNSDQPVPADAPDRFVAYVFDDLHLAAGDLLRIRAAAARHMSTLGITERAAIFTTSGTVEMEFTDDREKFRETLAKVNPRPAGTSRIAQCPDIDYYLSDLIVNKNDPIATNATAREAMVCMNLDPTDPNSLQTAIRVTQGTARQVLSEGSQQTKVTLYVLRDLIRRMAAMPGQRTMILASPGFLTPDESQMKTEILDRAIRANVIISAVDARGLYTDPTFDASRSGAYGTQDFSRVKAQYERDSARAQADVLAELSVGTGGNFFENNNDLEAGFKRVAGAPEYYYVLGFSPQNLKLDGSFHALKVSLKDPGGLTSMARRGYYAPKHLTDAEENAKEELREAVFSREEMHDLPVDLHTQFFKPTDDTAKVTVLMHVDLKRLRLRKSEGRNRNNLTVVSALFDRNGNYVTGNQKLLEMRLKDETLEKRAESGLTVRSSFDVKPGTYIVRLVVRDAEGQMMSATNGAVEIP